MSRTDRVRLLRNVLLLSLAGILAMPLQAASPSLTPVALSGTDGQFGPNLGPGVIFTALSGFQSVNNSNELAFQATIRLTTGATRQGIWKASSSGALSLVALNGTSSPAGPDVAGASFSDLSRPILSENGLVGFSANYDAPSGAGSGLFIDNDLSTPQAVALLNTDGPLGPNLGPGVRFSTFPLNDQLSAITPFTADGVFTFVAPLTGAGVTPTNNAGVFQASTAGVTPVARTGVTGALGPGLASGATFTGFASDANPVSPGQDAVAIRANVTGGDINFFTQQGSWLMENAGPPNIVVQSGVSGSLGPQIPGTFTGLSRPSINSAGVVSFFGIVDAATSGAWRISPGGSPEPRVVTGTDGLLGPGLGTGVTFTSFPASFAGVFSNAGELFTRATIAGPGVTSANDTGIWRVSDSGVELIAREGSLPTIAGLPAGATMSLGNLMTTDHGFIVGVLLQGPGLDEENNSAALSWSNGTFSLLVRTGDMVDVDPGAGEDLRRIQEFALFQNDPSSGADGLPRSFNANGLVSMKLSFTDGSNGIFTTVVPEPSGFVLASLAILAVLCVYGRRRNPLR